MAPDHQQDWIDRIVARDGMWEPPAHFVDRLSLQGFQALPARQPRPAGIVGRLRTLSGDVREDLTLRIQGYLWVLRQYRELLFS